MAMLKVSVGSVSINAFAVGGATCGTKFGTTIKGSTGSITYAILLWRF